MRVHSGGFENQLVSYALATNAEIRSSGQRSGNYALRVRNFASDARGVQKNISVSALAAGYHCVYVRVDALPDVNTLVIKGSGASGLNASNQVSLRLNTDGTFWFRHFSAGSAGPSAAIFADGSWHKLEFFWDVSAASGSRLGQAWLDDVQFANISNGTFSGLTHLAWGGGLDPGTPAAVTTLDISFDDWSLNDTAGSDQNGRCSGGKMVYLRPNADVGTPQWAVGAGGSANFNRVNEEQADDATTYNVCNTAGVQQDLFSLDDATARGIGASDQIVLIQVGSKIGSNTTTVAVGRDMRMSVKDSIGQTDSAIIDCSTNGFAYHSDPAPNVYQLTMYRRSDNAAWTTADLDALQAGYREGNSSTMNRRITQLWVLVEYIPATVQQLRPDADLASGSWSPTPLWSRVDEASAGGDVVSDTAH